MAVALFAAALTPLQGSAAEIDDYDAAIEMAMDYRYGQAVPLLRNAAERGDQRAQRTLAQMLFHSQSVSGEEVDQDRAEAGHWFHCAAAQGCWVSRHYLNHYYASSNTQVADHTACP